MALCLTLHDARSTVCETPPPPLNELANWLLARSCLTAIAAFPLFGMLGLSGQTTVEADLTGVLQSVNGNHLLHAPAPGVGGTLIHHGNPRPSEDAAARSEDCVWCVPAVTPPEVYWHRTTEDDSDAPWWWPIRYGIGHGAHGWWQSGNCNIFHGWCYPWANSVQEFTRGISDAVATRDVVALARYANLPSVSLFAKRSAIQVRDCDGETIAAHIPVNPELLVAIGVAAAQLDFDG